MKAIGTIFLTMLLLFSGEIMPQTAASDMPIVPTPQEWHWQDGILELQASLPIRIDNDLRDEAEILQEIIANQTSLLLKIESFKPQDLKKTGVILANPEQNAEVKNWLVQHQLRFTPAMEEEGYILFIDGERLLLTAKTKRGIFYGIQSIRFLLRAKSPKNQIPGVIIRDWPDLKLRGITDDISRGQVSTMENFKAIIRFLAEYKMNVYMPYLEDMFIFKSYPAIGLNRGALTAQECLELQDYAEHYHVSIIPIFQTLGHYENILFRPEFRHLAEFPGAASLNVSSEETYQFLETVLNEIIPVFHSIYFHIGADESWDVGHGASRARTERFGLASVHAEHYRRVIEIVRRHQRKVMMYSDIVLQNPTILNEIPQDVIFFDWHYGPRDFYESSEVFKKANRPFIVSPGIHNWMRIFPNLTDGLANIHQLSLDGSKNGAIGSITSNWGDYGGPNLRELNYYPFAYASECSWSPERANLLRFEQNFFRAFYGSSDPGFANVYHLLNICSQQVSFMHFFGHPFYPVGKNPIGLIRQSTELNLYSQQIQAELMRLKSLAKYRADHLDFLSLCANLFGWYGRLGELRLQLYKTNKYQIQPEKRKSLVPEYQKKLRQLAEELKKLKDSYWQLWLRTNRSDNLHRILSLMDRLCQYLQIKADEIAEGNFSFNGSMPAPFISHPKAKESEAEVPIIYLRKRFHLDKTPDKAYVQTIADSHARVWINGKEIGEVLARKSLSALVESERVKAWDVSPYLKKGENVLTVKVRNYITGRVAAANLWLEMHFGKKGRRIITSNNYWKVSDRQEKDWQLLSFKDQHWLPAAKVKNSWRISRPYFDRALPSRIEFYRK